MPEIAWHFTRQTPDMKSRNAMQQKFFELDKAIVVSLIRESIQNSLDAKDHDTEGPVRVRIFISGQHYALSSRQTQTFLTDTAWDHFNARGNGLDSIRPRRDEPCHYIVIEDFGTTGLNGNILEWSKPEKGENHFYHFFRAEGESDKGLSKASLGKHGVGKIVFPMASRLKTFFGLTVRKEDNKKYLVGQSVLKHHKLNGAPYTPDGWFGCYNGDRLLMPIDNDSAPDIVTEFTTTFNLKRSTETGLSVVIPYVSDEIENQAIVTSIVEDYFWAILKESLVLSIISPDGEFSIEKGSLAAIAATLGFDDELRAKIELAKWAASVEPDDLIQINAPRPTAPPKWDECLIDPELRVQLRKSLEAEEQIAIRVPLTIRERTIDGQEAETYYDVFLQRNAQAKSGRPVFIREGIIVPGASSNKRPGTLALVIAEDPALAAFLGDAEGPAHTEWSANAEDFKNKYVYGVQTLYFVKNTIGGIIDILDESSKQEDRTLLLDFFSIPVPTEGPERKSRKPKKDGDETEDIPIDIKSNPKRFRVGKVEGGFTISNAEKAVKLPAILDVKVFYDRRGGTARYSPYDFRLDKPPFVFKGKGFLDDKIEARENRLKAQIIDPEFKLTVMGFDIKRDVLVKPSVTEMESENATS